MTFVAAGRSGQVRPTVFAARSHTLSFHPQRFSFQWDKSTANNAHMDTDFSRAWMVLKSLTRATALFWLGTSVAMVGVAYWFSR